MNLIEELGIEKCQAIVSGVSDAHFFGCTIDTAIYWLNQSNEYHSTPMLFPNMSNQTAYVLDDLRTAITGHDCNHTDNLSHFTDSCTDIRNHDLSVSNSSQNNTQIDLSIKMDIEDNCTDIRNHISPNTKVIER